MKFFWRAVLVAVLAVGAFLAWRHFFPNDEAQIRQRLNKLAAAASIPSNPSPMGSLVAMDRLRGYFTPDVDITVDAMEGQPQQTFSNRDELLQLVGAARLKLKGLKVEFSDINVTVDSSRTNATSDLTLRVTQSNDLTIRLLKLKLQKKDGDWRISHAESAKVLQ